jgi:hypothetical protein
MRALPEKSPPSIEAYDNVSLGDVLSTLLDFPDNDGGDNYLKN